MGHWHFARYFLSSLEMRNVSTAPNSATWRTMSSPYAESPPSVFLISLNSLWTISFSEVICISTMAPWAASTNSFSPDSSVYPVSKKGFTTFFMSSWWR